MPDTLSTATSLESMLLSALAVIVMVIFIGAIYSFVRAIWGFIFSNGDAEKIKGAWNSIRYMLIGITFTVVLLYVIPLLLDAVGLQCTKGVSCSDAFSASQIFDRARFLWSSTLSMGEQYQQEVGVPGLNRDPSTLPQNSDFNL